MKLAIDGDDDEEGNEGSVCAESGQRVLVVGGGESHELLVINVCLVAALFSLCPHFPFATTTA